MSAPRVLRSAASSNVQRVMTLVRAAAIAAISIAALGCMDKGRAGESAGTRAVQIGSPAPAYATVSLAGDSVSLAKLRGKVVVLNIWATWCHPCRKEIPELRALHEKYQGRGLELVGVSVDNDGSDDVIREFMTEFAMNFPVWRDPDERISTRFLTVGVPTTFLIDREGILRWKNIGPIAPNDTAFQAAIERALGS